MTKLVCASMCDTVCIEQDSLCWGCSNVGRWTWPHSAEKKRKLYASQEAACIVERFPYYQASKGLSTGPSYLI
eukprot:1158562-Pelagomonas_calceolata.AAC.3